MKMITFAGIEFSGRTTTILNLAYLLVKENNNVLIIDADQTRGGKITSILNLPNKETGLAEAVTSLEKETLSEAFILDKKTGITFLTLPNHAKCNDLFSMTSLQAETFYNRIKNDFDYIFIDSGSILYESLSAVSLFVSDKILVMLTPEKRSIRWLQSFESVLKHFKNKIDHVSINLTETPESCLDQEKKIEIPYIFNMRDYAIDGEIYLKNPTGKKAKDYIRSLRNVMEVL